VRLARLSSRIGPSGGHRLNAFWTLLNTRAISVSVANDALNFGISWLGIVLIIAAMLVWRRLRR
jgi:hypothetical protein